MSIVAIGVIGVLFLIGCSRPLWALALLFTMFPIEQCLQANSSIFIDQSKIVNLAVALVVGIALARLAMTGQLVLRHWMNVVSAACLLLYGWAALSYFWTFSPEWLAEYIRLSLPYVILIVFVGPLLLSRLSKIGELRTAIMVMGTIVSILLMTNPNFHLYAGRYVLALDAATNTNPLAIGTLGGLLVLAAALGPPTTGNRLALVLRLAAFVAGLGLAFLSGSRGQVVFAVLCAIAFYPMSRRMTNWSNFVGLLFGLAILAVGVFAVRSLFISAENEERWSPESLLFGGEGRLENVMDLANAYLQRPTYWPSGLGCLAFHDLPTTGGDPYSHVLIADIIFELGVPGVVLSLTIAFATTWNAIKLFALVAHDPQKRADMTFLLAFTVFEFMLANKAGQLWGQTGLFMGCCMIARLRYIEEDDVALAASRQFEEYTEESGNDARSSDLDDRISGRLVTS